MLLWVALSSSALAYGQAPSFQDLMDPAVFSKAQRGMLLEDASVDGTTLRCVTTGAVMSLDAATGEAVFRQRIGHDRDLVAVRFSRSLAEPPELHAKSDGLVLASLASPRVDIRANGDSLFMFHVHEPLDVVIKRRIDIAFVSSDMSNVLLLDEWGGFGIYCSDKTLDNAFDRFGPITARYTLPADAVLWIAVCPPKPYDWPRSVTDNVVWHWSRETSYPPDETLASWAAEGNIVLLQSEVMLWKDWNLAFEPRLGEAEFARVRDTIHRNGMRFIVYTSPGYFFKGTPYEPYALNSFEDFKGWPPCRGLGDNIDLFMAEITRVMAQYKPDGLYFDGQYFDNPAALYALARRTRDLLGEDGILEWHSTTALGSGLCCLPQADAYVDFILRGEGRDSAYGSFDYLRFFVSCYNVSNSIGVLCNNGPHPDADLINRALEANCRLHTIVSWFPDTAAMEALNTAYRPKMNLALREQVDRAVDQRQAVVAAQAEALRREYATIEAEPAWSQAVLVETFDALPVAEKVASPANRNAFASRDGALAVTGHAHTYAFLRMPVDHVATGFVVKLKRHTDGGMSWGPAVALQWPDGSLLRVGLRVDGCLQSDINGTQRLAEACAADDWVWLRARWLEHTGVIERSDNGTDFHRVWFFEHGPSMMTPVHAVLVGKVPYNGEAEDHSDPGESGTSFIDELVIY